MVIDALLDTSVIIDLLRGDPHAVSWHQSLGNQTLAISPIVWMETVQGASNKVRMTQFVRFLRQFQVEHPIPKDNEWAMKQFEKFHLSHRIDYTLNIRHYAPLPDLDEQKPY